MDITAERCEQVISDLKRISVQDAHRCLGCGREHNCSLHGCAIIRDAVDLIQSLSARSAAKRTTIMPNDIVLHVPSGENGPYAAWITYEVSLFPTDIRSRPSHKLVTVSCSNCAMNRWDRPARQLKSLKNADFTGSLTRAG